MPKMSEELYSETLNIKKLVNLRANTKNYGQIILNTNPHSDPPILGLYLLSGRGREISPSFGSFGSVGEISVDSILIVWFKFGRKLRKS